MGFLDKLFKRKQKDECDFEIDESVTCEISTPFGFQHNVHVDYNSDTGFSGLPSEWEGMLKGIITKQEVLENPDDVLGALKIVANNGAALGGNGGNQMKPIVDSSGKKKRDWVIF